MTRTRRIRRRASRGLTLLEVLIATAMLATVLGIALPNFRGMRAPWALRTATNRIVADVQAARQRAIARNVRYRVTFTATGYTVERETAPNTWTTDGAAQSLPSTATIGTVTGGNPIFDSRGMLVGTVTIPVTVPMAGTKTVTINVLGKTTIG